jgi:hypothetical protein
MKIVTCICVSLVLFLPLIASGDDKHKANKPQSGGGGKAAHATAAPAAVASKAAPTGAGRTFGRGAPMSRTGHNPAGNNLQSAGQTGHAQHGLNSHQDAQHGLKADEGAQHGLHSQQGSQHGLSSHQGAQRGLNARAGNDLKGHQAAKLSVNHSINRGFAREGRFGGSHWRSGQHWRNYHALYSGYHRSWHDRGWWRGHYSRVVFVGGNYWGGNWYWDGGYWFPAWGYDPVYSGYVYDGPIFAYANLPPDQVVVNIQEALQDQGYYAGEIDGQLGQQTRDALAAYQRDHNLELTAAIDEATVQALGLTTAEEV